MFIEVPSFQEPLIALKNSWLRAYGWYFCKIVIQKLNDGSVMDVFSETI